MTAFLKREKSTCIYWYGQYAVWNHSIDLQKRLSILKGAIHKLCWLQESQRVLELYLACCEFNPGAGSHNSGKSWQACKQGHAIIGRCTKVFSLIRNFYHLFSKKIYEHSFHLLFSPYLRSRCCLDPKMHFTANYFSGKYKIWWFQLLLVTYNKLLCTKG